MKCGVREYYRYKNIFFLTYWYAMEGSIWCEYQVHRNIQGDSHQNKCDIVKKSRNMRGKDLL